LEQHDEREVMHLERLFLHAIIHADKIVRVMNNICIHMRARGPNTYMYKREEYTKNSLEKYNNRKS
jgi:hypothetical protein